MITIEQINAKCVELTEKLGVKVIPISFLVSDNDRAVGYMKNPGYQERAFAFEKTTTGNAMDGAEAILTRCLIVEESDKRLLDDSEPEIKFSAVSSCVSFIKGYDNEIKKK